MNATGAAASGWQLVFASLAVVVLLLELVRGWRLGLMRQVVRFLAVLSAFVAARYGGPVVLPLLRSSLKMPDPILSWVGGAILAAIVYAIISSIGAALFKRTDQQQTKPLRWLWGSSGAVLGMFFGVLFLWLVFAGVRMIGSLAATQVRSQHALTSATMQPVWNRPLQIAGRSPAPAPTSDPLLDTLREMKEALSTGALGSALQQIDPVPPTTYRTLEKLSAVSSNVASAERFLSFPGVREIGDDPKVVALRNDPEIMQLIAQGRLLELLQNERLIAAMNDPALRERIRTLDLERALDYALQVRPSRAEPRDSAR